MRRLTVMPAAALACALVLALVSMPVAVHADTEIKQDIKDAGHAVGRTFKKGAHEIKDGVKEGAHKVKEGVKKGAHKVKDGVKRGVKKVRNKIRD